MMPSTAEPLLVDDFSSGDGHSALGTPWQGFTDRVMGGLSDMQAGYVSHGGLRHLRMQGQVRVENNGGFIQVRVPLARNGNGLDARQWVGVALRVRGLAGPYYLHLRSADNRRPWQYYAARIEIGEDWHEQFIPFTSFEPRSTTIPLNLADLRSLGVVAYGEAFNADIEIARVELR